MNRIIMAILSMAVIFIFCCSCSNDTYLKEGISRDNNKNEEKSEYSSKGADEMEKNSEKLYGLFVKDKRGDGKSVFWDGKTADIGVDDNDRTDYQDGFRAFSHVQVFEVKDLFELNHPDGKENMELKKISDLEFELEDDIGVLRIGLVDFKEEYDRLRSLGDSLEIESDFLYEDKKETISNNACFVYINDNGNAGYEFLFTSKKNSLTYKLSYDGIGNFTQITKDFRYLVNKLYIPIPPNAKNVND